jgi:anti-sigma regulatory factor (Ser/Thr protein kinase)
VTLRIPADASQIGTVRIVAGAVGRHAALTDEQVKDLKLVLSELCADVIERAGHGAFVEISFLDEAGALETEVRAPAPSPERTTSDIGTQRRRLLDALVPSMRTIVEGTQQVSRFRLP